MGKVLSKMTRGEKAGVLIGLVLWAVALGWFRDEWRGLIGLAGLTLIVAIPGWVQQWKDWRFVRNYHKVKGER